MSLFNIFGRLFWSSASEIVGRFALYNLFFLLGITCYSTLPLTARRSEEGLIFTLGVIVSIYGGVFAAVPAYIKDLFGVKYAGSIHGRMVSRRRRKRRGKRGG